MENSPTDVYGGAWIQAIRTHLGNNGTTGGVEVNAQELVIQEPTSSWRDDRQTTTHTLEKMRTKVKKLLNSGPQVGHTRKHLLENTEQILTASDR